LNNTGIKTVSV